MTRVAKMVSRRTGIKAVEIPGVGHTPWLSEPEALTALRQFLEVRRCEPDDRENHHADQIIFATIGKHRQVHPAPRC